MSYSQRVSSFLNFPSRELNALPSYNLPLRPLLELLKWDHQTCACFFSKCNLLNVRVSWFRKRTGARWLMAKFGGVCYRCCCSRTTAAAMTTQSLVLFSTQTEPSRRISVAQPPCTGFSFLAELNKTSFSLSLSLRSSPRKLRSLQTQHLKQALISPLCVVNLLSAVVSLFLQTATWCWYFNAKHT